MAEIPEFLQSAGEFLDRISLGAGRVLKELFGSRNLRVIRQLGPLVQRINELEPEIEALSADDLKRRTPAFRERLAQGEPLDDLLPEAFACVREASRRTLGLRHFDVQMMGGVVLHRGQIAEMATGEGKTLVATAPAYLNALLQRGVFIVTVNDYLAQRDCDWMRPIYDALGVSVAAIQSSMDPSRRQPMYAADITYGTNNEFGFDYLRDNMKSRLRDQVQKHLYYAIVDEVDSILIDEARTPLIISGLPDTSTDKYYKADQIARQLKPGADFEVKEKEHQCILTDEGIEKAQRLAGVDSFYTGSSMDWPHHLEQALRAHNLYRKDRDYVVKADDDGQPGIIIVDEFTGRLMPGRRWSDGLHQAIEASQGLRIREEHQTLATITFQNYFRLYEKLAGMTGTAMTEATEFANIYKLDVVQVPTNRPNVRQDGNDFIYLTEVEKYATIVREIVEVHQSGRPALVGTISIEKSERLSKLLSDPRGMHLYLAKVCELAAAELDKVAAKRPGWLPAEREAAIRKLMERPAFLDVAAARRLADELLDEAPKELLAWHLDQVAHFGNAAAAVQAGLPHNVLNAKFHKSEAEIVAQAGRAGTITIATNMAGRGTDILLGGNPEALARERLAPEATPEERAAELKRCRAECEEEKQRILALGGLQIIGTERHEARRIDNQLRGRCARQGDPGSTRFFLSLEDDLMRIFARDWVAGMLKRLGMIHGQEIESRMVSRGIEKAQRRVEQRNFEIRKNVLEYDEVMDKQRKTIYSLRQEILEGIDLKDRILDMCGAVVERLMDTYLGENQKDWNLEEFAERLNRAFGTRFSAADFARCDRDKVREMANEGMRRAYDEREGLVGAEQMREIERFLLLNVIDSKWKDHLHAMQQLRENVGLRSYAQIDPKSEYKREGFENFQKLMVVVEDEVTNLIFRIQVVREEDERKLETRWQAEGHSGGRLAAPDGSAAQATAVEMERERRKRESAAVHAGRGGRPVRPIKREAPRVGRNDPCPCKSGKKYKKCCYPKFGG
ncbi:MAG: preprotein translocase subunit SecA [Planctomycetes bacterium]|nr:preprotein translocase subunit SecA [Planctomycetota bacterium]